MSDAAIVEGFRVSGAPTEDELAAILATLAALSGQRDPAHSPYERWRRTRLDALRHRP